VSDGIVCDIGYGGAFYAILPASRLGLDLHATPAGRLRSAALAVMRAIQAHGEVHHPTEPDLGFLYGAILTDDTPPGAPSATRHLCVFGGIVTLTFARQPEVGDDFAAHHAAFRTHVPCCQTLKASVRSARYAEAASRCRRGWK
jgi:hypothetical protein